MREWASDHARQRDEGTAESPRRRADEPPALIQRLAAGPAQFAALAATIGNRAATRLLATDNPAIQRTEEATPATKFTDLSDGRLEELFRRGHIRLEDLGLTVADVAAMARSSEPKEREEAERVRRSLPMTGAVPTGDVRPTQYDVKDTTQDGVPLDRVAGSMRRHGWRGGPVDAVAWGDGTVASIDNRRVVAAHRAELREVPAALHKPNDPLTPRRDMPVGRIAAFRLLEPILELSDGRLVVGGSEGVVRYEKGDLPTTWGEAALFRAANQRKKTGHSIPLFGNTELPIVKPSSGGTG